MWDPNETLASWALDDDVLSWRSLDTLRCVETDHGHHDRLREEGLEDAKSDVSDLDELAEVVEKQPSRFAIPSQSVQWSHEDRPPSMLDKRLAPAVTANSLAGGWAKAADNRKNLLQDDLMLRELPSTSEMVRIQELMPVHERLPVVTFGGQINPFDQLECSAYSHDKMAHDEPTAKLPIRAPAIELLQRSLGQSETRRVSMTLGDLMAKKNANTSTILPATPPPPPAFALPPATDPSPPPPESSTRLHDLKMLERRCEDLAEKDRHLQAILAKQLYQIETLSDQLRQQDAKYNSQQLELSGLKEHTTRLDRENTTLQTSIREKEHAQEQQTQLLVQKTNELTALESKVRSLHIANESYQEQARKAIEEKDKVHKDYLQVVFELSKLQKQMNAAAKETVNIAERDLLLREIDQLRHEKDLLSTKLKESEARKSSLLQNNAAVEAQKIRELQNRVRELEEDLYRAINQRTTQAPTQQSYTSSLFPPPPAPTSQPPSRRQQSNLDGYQSASQYDFPRPSNTATAPQMTSWGQQEQPEMPTLMNRMQLNSGGTKPMTLKDMMGDRRPQPTTAVSSNSLASLGYSMADRRSNGTTNSAFDFEQFKADAIARRSTSVGDVLCKQSIHDLPEYSFASPPDPALAAPFATEKQTLLHDSLSKRDLEQKLLKLHVEKEQMEAKLLKVEQTGLKTMSARTEKTWVESRLRDLTLEVGRLKLSLR